ncbi:MAG TPA: amino acid permease [Steroidobacteraceae bacterium]|nr:amino acid permease [Steroidobacteraceae bacterium]
MRASGAQQGLRAGVLGKALLTGLGLSYIVAGNYAAWGFGLGRGGWGGLLIAFCTVAVFYACLVACLAELATALPVAGGGYAFALRAFGAPLGFVAGMAIALEYVCSGSALSLFAAGYFQSLTGLDGPGPVIILYVLVALAHVWGVGEALGVTLLLAAVAAAGVLVFIFSLAPAFHAGRLFDVAPGGWLPFGWYGIWAALPFAVTFLISIEGVPLAAEEAAEPSRTLPKAMFTALAIGVILALGVLLCGPGSAGTAALLNSPDPMSTALQQAAVANGTLPMIHLVVTVAALIGLLASFCGAMFAGSRMLYALAREGVLPAVIGRVNARGAPWVATLVTAVAGLALAATGLADQLVVLLVFGATLSYLLILAAHGVLRRREPELRRPYRTPGALATPALGLALAAAIFVACFLADWRWSCVGVGIIAIASVARWIGRHGVVSDPA